MSHGIVLLMRRPAFSLLELVLVLTMLATLFLAALPALGHARRVVAVRAARAELLAAIAQTRALAIRRGGAQLVVDTTGVLRVHALDGTPLAAPVRLTAHQDVRVGTGAGAPVTLRYDALGIGRMANATIQLRAGDVRATVTVSAYGRAR